MKEYFVLILGADNKVMCHVNDGQSEPSTRCTGHLTNIAWQYSATIALFLHEVI